MLPGQGFLHKILVVHMYKKKYEKITCYNSSCDIKSQTGGTERKDKAVQRIISGLLTISIHIVWRSKWLELSAAPTASHQPRIVAVTRALGLQGSVLQRQYDPWDDMILLKKKDQPGMLAWFGGGLLKDIIPNSLLLLHSLHELWGYCSLGSPLSEPLWQLRSSSVSTGHLSIKSNQIHFILNCGSE